ncbi:hypothetical protein J4730_26865 [Klebsiella pneumoniae]|uniref:Uncharacterized protein n=1 Tax=Klebsiella pneumoniae TaxID=573 RepID=A0A939SUB4_KLEPN|nr:hypothetical protein [Klebsiella pneumoniae]
MSHVGWRSTAPLGHSHRLCPGLCARWRYADWPTNAPAHQMRTRRPADWPTNIPVPENYFWH